MECKVIVIADGYPSEWDIYEAENEAQALEMAIENRKEICEDLYSITEEFCEKLGYEDAYDLLADISYRPYKNGFIQFIGYNFFQSFTFEVEEV